MRATISRTELFAFIRSLGAVPKDVRSIQIEPDVITVETYRRDEDGKYVIAGDDVATQVTTIAIAGSGDATTVRMRHPALDCEVDVPATAVGHHAVAGWEVVARETTPEAEPEKSDESEPTPDDDKPKNTPRGRRKRKESE